MSVLKRVKTSVVVGGKKNLSCNWDAFQELGCWEGERHVLFRPALGDGLVQGGPDLAQSTVVLAFCHQMCIKWSWLQFPPHSNMEGQPEGPEAAVLCCRLAWLWGLPWDVQSLQHELLHCDWIVAFKSLGCILVSCHNKCISALLAPVLPKPLSFFTVAYVLFQM